MRTCLLIVERIRQERQGTRDSMQPDKPVRVACAAVFGCAPTELPQRMVNQRGRVSFQESVSVPVEFILRDSPNVKSLPLTG